MKILYLFLVVALIACPVWAVTIQGFYGSSMQGGAARMQGVGIVILPSGGDKLREDGSVKLREDGFAKLRE